MCDIKDIFVDVFEIHNLNKKAPILEQLVHIVDKVNHEDIETNEKLMKWSEKKFEHKVLEKVSTKIVIK